MKKVKVLLSTYNGEKYLRELVESVLSQKDVNIKLLIRDDGSNDSTHEILDELSSQKNISIEYAENVGWRKSFMSLISTVRIEDDCFYAFADQDDVWKSDKMSSAIEMIDVNQPMLYHSNMTLVDSNMKVIANKYVDNFTPTSQMPQAFFDGIGTGATMVMNSALVELIQQYLPNQEIAHDAYIMALANLLGTTIYDGESHILYRRHNDTATGFKNSKKIDKPTLLDRYERYKKMPKNSYSIRAEQLFEGYTDNLTLPQRKLMKKIGNYRNHLMIKFSLLLSPQIRATSLKKTLLIKYRIICNTL